MTIQIHGDLSKVCSVDSRHMDWEPSPSSTVWRKRLHLVGTAEAGQVTSIVRYEPGSKFHEHEHPDGEEILVLEGVFSDEQGDWPAGTFLLNPEGFRHAPFSEQGCELFVKLRQFPGKNRRKVAVNTNTLPWNIGATPGVTLKPLYYQDDFTDTMALEMWQPGVNPGVVAYPEGAEILVIEGSFSDQDGDYDPGHWLRFPIGAEHRPQTDSGCVLYIKRGGLSYLRSCV